MDKALNEYNEAHPLQLMLFQVSDHIDTKYRLAPGEAIEHSQYSNTFEFFDGIPKYVYSKSTWKDGDPVFGVERGFGHRGKDWKVKMTPAMIAGKDNVLRPAFPGVRERYVLDAIVKLSLHEDKGVFLDDRYGLKFNLRDLSRELKEQGRTYSIQQITEALQILRKTSYDIFYSTGTKAKLEYSFNVISELGLLTLDEWRENKGEGACYIRLAQMMHDSLMEKSYRLFNYVQNTNYRSVIASDLHKRMSHHFTQASPEKEYSMYVSTMIRDFGLTPCSQFRDNVRQVEAALIEMKESGVVNEYRIEMKYGHKEDPTNKPGQSKRRTKPSLIDALVHIKPGGDFSREVFMANGLKKKIAGNDIKTLGLQYPHHKGLKLMNGKKE